MKIFVPLSLLLASSNAFSVSPSNKASLTALRMSDGNYYATPQQQPEPAAATNGQNGSRSAAPQPPVPAAPAAPAAIAGPQAMFPIDLPLKRIEGANTLVTYKMPEWTDRVQYVLKTNGRPMKAQVEMWVGPIRRTHNLEIDMEDGDETPFVGTLKFKKTGPQMLKINTNDLNMEMPLLAGVSVPSPEQAKLIESYSEGLFDASPKTRIQGGTTDGGKSAVRTFQLDTQIESVQIMIWSKNSGKKSSRLMLEVLQGPNNPKQKYTLQCSSSSQPYHCVVQTPGEGNTLRITNKKYLEDGLFEIVIIPMELAPGAPESLRQAIMPTAQTAPSFGARMPSKQWWEK